MCLVESSNNGKFDSIAKRVMDGKAEDAKHSGAAVVELDGALLVLLLLGEHVPTVINAKGHVAEVSNVLALTSDITHDEELEPSDEEDDLKEPRLGNGVRAVECTEAIGDVRESATGKVNRATKVDARAGDNVSEEGKHGNASVLDLDKAKTVELGLVSIGDKSEGIEKAERGLDAELILERVQCGGGLPGLGRSESSGRADKGSEDSNGLHG